MPVEANLAVRRGGVEVTQMNTAEIARARQDGRLWYVVHTHMRCEPTAARNLEQQGFTTYLPLRLRTVRHARQARTLKDAYFPRYLFVALDLERDRWRSVSSTVGVVHFVSSGEPAPAPRPGGAATGRSGSGSRQPVRSSAEPVGPALRAWPRGAVGRTRVGPGWDSRPSRLEANRRHPQCRGKSDGEHL